MNNKELKEVETIFVRSVFIKNMYNIIIKKFPSATGKNDMFFSRKCFYNLQILTFSFKCSKKKRFLLLEKTFSHFRSNFRFSIKF